MKMEKAVSGGEMERVRGKKTKTGACGEAQRRFRSMRSDGLGPVYMT